MTGVEKSNPSVHLIPTCAKQDDNTDVEKKKKKKKRHFRSQDWRCKEAKNPSNRRMRRKT